MDSDVYSSDLIGRFLVGTVGSKFSIRGGWPRSVAMGKSKKGGTPPARVPQTSTSHPPSSVSFGGAPLGKGGARSGTSALSGHVEIGRASCRERGCQYV